MLGKRCRTIQRTASISQNMGPHYLHHHNYHQQHDVTAATKAINHADAIVLGHHAHVGNSQVPAIIPQIIGFNPMIKSANYAGGGDHEVSQQPKLVGTSTGTADFNGTLSTPPPNMLGRPQPHDMYDDDPKHYNTRGAGSSGSPSTKRSQITPRSALQTLLAAARQITYSDQSSASNANSYPCKSSEMASKSSFKNNPTSPSCASNSTLNAAKQGSFIWQGLTVLGEATISKELPSSKQFMSTPKASKPVITTHAPHEFSQNYNMINEAPPHEYIHNVQSMSEVDSENIFDVEGTSSSHSGGAIGLHPISCFEPTEDHHALYLATSPLTADFIPNLATSMSFLDSCYLCKRPLGQGRDIFMYRGENAFCSMECRDKQMRLEDRKEKLRSIHSQMNKLNVEKQGLHVKSSNAGMGSTSTNTTSCYHPHQQPPHSKHLPHHHQQYAANHSQQAVAYNNKQHRISLLMPAA